MKVAILFMPLLGLVARATDITPTYMPTSAPAVMVLPSATRANPPILTLTPIPTPSPTLMPTQTLLGTPARIDTQGWKTFGNSDYGFGIKYPPTFTYALGTGFPDKDLLFHVAFFDANLKPSDAGFRAIGLFVLANPKRLGLKAYFDENVDTNVQSPKIVPGVVFSAPTNIGEVQIAGIRSLRFIHYPLGFIQPAVLVPSPGNAHFILVAYDDHPELEPIFEAMTQTLEFQR